MDPSARAHGYAVHALCAEVQWTRTVFSGGVSARRSARMRLGAYAETPIPEKTHTVASRSHRHGHGRRRRLGVNMSSLWLCANSAQCGPMICALALRHGGHTVSVEPQCGLLFSLQRPRLGGQERSEFIRQSLWPLQRKEDLHCSLAQALRVRARPGQGTEKMLPLQREALILTGMRFQEHARNER